MGPSGKRLVTPMANWNSAASLLNRSGTQRDAEGMECHSGVIDLRPHTPRNVFNEKRRSVEYSRIRRQFVGQVFHGVSDPGNHLLGYVDWMEMARVETGSAHRIRRLKGNRFLIE